MNRNHSLKCYKKKYDEKSVLLSNLWRTQMYISFQPAIHKQRTDMAGSNLAPTVRAGEKFEVVVAGRRLRSPPEPSGFTVEGSYGAERAGEHDVLLFTNEALGSRSWRAGIP
jgi:hypothetical protein